MLGLDLAKLDKLRHMLSQLVNILLDIEQLRDIVTPLPLENYASLLSSELREYIDALTSKRVQDMLLHMLRLLAITAQSCERLIDIVDLRTRLTSGRQLVRAIEIEARGTKTLPELNV